MNDNKMKGIVLKVNGTGILLGTREKPDGEWWNGLGKVTEYIKPDLIGNEIEISIQDIEKHKFTFLKNISKAENKAVVSEKRDRERIIVRQNALSHATAFTCKAWDNFNNINEAEIFLFQEAEKFEEWVMRK